jgi:thiol-disulfide isomerase/thioredoxin
MRLWKLALPIAGILLSLLATATSSALNFAPPFELPTWDGKIVQLSDLKGKVVILDLWATWCTPCLASAPTLSNLQARFRNQGLVVLGVSLDTDIEKLRAFIAQRPPGLIVVTPTGDFNKAYGRVLRLKDDRIVAPDRPIDANLPSWILIDRDGVVRSIHKSSIEEPQLLAETERLFTQTLR